MINKILKKLKIKKGDFIMCHGDSIVATIFKKKNTNTSLKYFFNGLIRYIGKNGTLIVPAFSPSFTKTKFFDKNKTKSEAGYFSEFFRKMKLSKRTLHPIFSFSVYGKLYKKMLKCKTTDCFGKDTIFDFFYKKNGKILCCGNGFKQITFAIYVDQMIGVPYRFYKNFSGHIRGKKKKIKVCGNFGVF